MTRTRTTIEAAPEGQALVIEGHDSDGYRFRHLRNGLLALDMNGDCSLHLAVGGDGKIVLGIACKQGLALMMPADYAAKVGQQLLDLARDAQGGAA